MLPSRNSPESTFRTISRLVREFRFKPIFTGPFELKGLYRPIARKQIT